MNLSNLEWLLLKIYVKCENELLVFNNILINKYISFLNKKFLNIRKN